MIIHVVKPNETVYSIANFYGVSASRIIYDNELYSSDSIVIGQALVILFPEIIHRVKAGETINSIAYLYNVPVTQIVRNNPYIVAEGYIYENELLIIKYQDTKLGAITVNGYAYPYINENILREAILYLTDLSIFSYGFTEEGKLVFPNERENELIRVANLYNVRPILVLTPFSKTGTFNNQLVKIVSSDITVQNNLIQNILDIVKQKQYEGVDVDFEYVLPEDKNGYIEFVENLKKVMNQNGYSVSVALAPKTSSVQAGLLYEGIDYENLAYNANSVLLMTYEWGYTFGPPMAVAPINKVREVLDYAITVIPSKKIDMGIPNYGYDWPLPYERGTTKAKTIGNTEAIQIAIDNNARIQFDETSKSPFFEYKKDGVEHIVWFEDARSIEAKFNIVLEYKFRGVGYWNIMKRFRPNWMLLNSMFEIE